MPGGSRGLAARLYPIIDTGVCRDRGFDPFDLAGACLRGGARLLQLRCKAGPSVAFLALAERVVARARPFGATILINDRADIARLAAAAGVHVGQDDLSVAQVRAIVGVHAIVGLSTHDEAQVDAAAETSASYIAVGPVFNTSTKATGDRPCGLDLVRYAARTGRPVVAIGGVTLENAPSVFAAGATSVAVISDLFVARDPESRVRAFEHLGP